MSVNFKICDTELVTLVEKSEYLSSQESEHWDNIEHRYEIEIWMKQVENSQIAQDDHPKIENDSLPNI